MSRLFGWDLPPGVSQRDIDEHFGDDGPSGECPECGEETDRFRPHGCDEDCRRGCKAVEPDVCSRCAEKCWCCSEAMGTGERFLVDGKNWCEECYNSCPQCGEARDGATQDGRLCVNCALESAEYAKGEA